MYRMKALVLLSILLGSFSEAQIFMFKPIPHPNNNLLSWIARSIPWKPNIKFEKGLKRTIMWFYQKAN